jgi:hypothetical protein
MAAAVVDPCEVVGLQESGHLASQARAESRMEYSRCVYDSIGLATLVDGPADSSVIVRVGGLGRPVHDWYVAVGELVRPWRLPPSFPGHGPIDGVGWLVRVRLRICSTDKFARRPCYSCKGSNGCMLVFSHECST